MKLKKLILTVIASFPKTKSWFNNTRLASRKLFKIDYEKDIDQIPEYLLNKGCLAIDIGANRGDFTQSLIFRGFRVIAFEPNPNPYEIMKRRFRKDNNIDVHNKACGAQNESLTLHIPCYKNYQIEGLASFNKAQVMHVLDKIRELKPYYFFNEKYVHARSINVQLVKLDEYNLQPDFIKIDTEGHEYEVIQGAIATIKSSRPVIYLEKPNHETQALLTSLGYKLILQGKNNQILIPSSSLE